MTDGTDVVLVDVADGVATITLNRPDARNALSLDVLKALPRVGDKRATLVMERYDIAANRRIRGLGRHQLAGLKAEFGER